MNSNVIKWINKTFLVTIAISQTFAIVITIVGIYGALYGALISDVPFIKTSLWQIVAAMVAALFFQHWFKKLEE